jgi:Ca2+-binding EF-hand superfamily protein
MLFALPTPPRTPPSLDAGTLQRSRSEGAAAGARRTRSLPSGAHSLPPLVREPLDLFSLNAKTAAAASAAKMASDDAIARITPSSPPAQPKGGGNMRRQLATSADNLSTQYPNNVLTQSPPKDTFLNPPIPDGQRGRLSPPVSSPTVSPPRQRLTSPTPHQVHLPHIASPPTAVEVVDLPSPGQLAEILAPQTERLVEVFRAWDEDGSGLVRQRDFCQALLPLLQQWDDASALFAPRELRPALEALFAELLGPEADAAHGGMQTIRYEHIRRLLKRVLKAERARFGDNPPAAANPAGRAARNAAKPRARADTATQLRDALTANAARVIELFRKWDEEGSGAVNRREFRALGPLLRDAVDDVVTRQQLDALFDSFDLDSAGTIDYNELHYLLRRAAAAGGGIGGMLSPIMQPGGAGDIAVKGENNNRLRTRPITPPHVPELRGGGELSSPPKRGQKPSALHLGRLRSQLRGHDVGVGAQIGPLDQAGRLGGKTDSIYSTAVVEGRYKPPALSLGHLRQQQAALAAARTHRRAHGGLPTSASEPVLKDGRSGWAADPRTHPMSRFYFDVKPLPGMSQPYQPVLAAADDSMSRRRRSPPRGSSRSPPRSKSPPRQRHSPTHAFSLRHSPT